MSRILATLLACAFFVTPLFSQTHREFVQDAILGE